MWQLQAYEEKEMGCGPFCNRGGDCSLATAAGDVGASCSMAPCGSSVFVHLRQQQNRRKTDARGGGGVNGEEGGGGCCELIDKTTDKATNTCNWKSI